MSQSSHRLDAAGPFFQSFFGRLKATDPILVLCLAISFFSGITALNWGRYDCLNPDATAFKSVKKWPPLHPERFDKPPLHTYINNTLINEPSKWVTGGCVFFGADKAEAEKTRWQARAIAARILQAILMLGCVVCVFRFARDHFGLASARASAILIATSASFLLNKIFLTTDISLVFWMLASLVASGRILKTGGMRASLAAGIFAGLATATKYNGLAVALAIPLAHMLYRDPRGTLAFLGRRSFWAGGFAVPISFILVNPYCILDFRKFASDFMYNYSVTPIYNGQTTGNGYGAFVAAFPEIFGWPLCLVLPVLFVCGLVWAVRKRPESAIAAMGLCAAVFALYFWKIGGFPRIETRFVLPSAPFLLLLAAPGWELFAKWRAAVAIPAVALGLYGLASGYEITRQFTEDPRMEALKWADRNFPDHCKVEASTGSPQWKWMHGKQVAVVNFPIGLERNRRFSETLKDNPWVQDRLQKNLSLNRPEFFTPGELASRNSDFITVDSQNLRDRVAAPFLDALLSGAYGYEVVFQKEAPPLPGWVYPAKPNCLRMKFYILRKKAGPPAK
ncbi:MAG: glycosyltransferase family 39 protein [Terrimicrobiaceae bacterium]